MLHMKATLRCHAHASKSVYRDIAASSTILGLLLPVLGWALSPRMVIHHSQPVHHGTVPLALPQDSFCQY